MYIIIFKIDNQHILALGKGGHILGYNTPEEVLEDFRGFTDKFTPGASYESYASAGIGMMNLQPIAVFFEEDPDFLKDFILDPKPMKYSGLGFHSVIGVPIHGLILEIGENINIWRESMIKAGIYDPLQSDFQDPFKFSL